MSEYNVCFSNVIKLMLKILISRHTFNNTSNKLIVKLMIKGKKLTLRLLNNWMCTDFRLLSESYILKNKK